MAKQEFAEAGKKEKGLLVAKYVEMLKYFRKFVFFYLVKRGKWGREGKERKEKEKREREKRERKEKEKREREREKRRKGLMRGIE